LILEFLFSIATAINFSEKGGMSFKETFSDLTKHQFMAMTNSFLTFYVYSMQIVVH